MQLGDTIKFLREKNNIKQGDLCDDIGVNRSYWSLVENNHKKPSHDMLEKFAEHIGLPVAVIFYFSLDLKDVPKEKIEVYNLLKPSIDNLILEIFNVKI